MGLLCAFIRSSEVEYAIKLGGMVRGEWKHWLVRGLGVWEMIFIALLKHRPKTIEGTHDEG
jgi:hypothetical protein